MIKKILSRRAVALGVLGLFLAALTLAACGGAAESEAEKPVGSNQAVADSETEESADHNEAEEAESEEAEAHEDEAAEESVDSSEETSDDTNDENLLNPAQDLPEQDNTPAACHTVEIPENPLIIPVSDIDWAKGPANAPVTIVEYGDFQ